MTGRRFFHAAMLLVGAALFVAEVCPRARAQPDVPLQLPPAVEVPKSPLPVGVSPVPATTAAATTGEAVEADEGAESAAAAEPRPAVDSRHLQFNLMDGSTITGELSIDEITVETEFGKLVVPVTKILSFVPGLDSYPELADQIASLIENLGSDDYQTREKSHKELAHLGLKIMDELRKHKNDKNVERQRHIGQILEELEQLAEEQDDLEFGEGGKDVWTRLDTVTTPKFTIAGRISPATFTVNSKYGPLTVKLSDIKTALRETGVKQPIRKQLTVEGTYLIQRSVKSSGIRVERGDKVSVTADGQLIMTPWGSNMVSNPDGGANFQWYDQTNQIPGGALVARIGDNGKVFKVGCRHTFVAETAGILNFAIAMQHQYATGSYQFPGQYNVRIRVEPQ